MYKIYGSKRSRAFRVLWALEEMALDYEFFEFGPRSDEVRALSPAGKVPVMVEGEHIITDSAAIITYLADKHDNLTERAGTIERAHQDAMTHFILDELDACLWTAARHSFVLPEERRVPDVKESLRWEWERSVKELMRRLDGKPFLMGENMTIADIFATHCGTWARNAKFDVSDPGFSDYINRMTARPAWRRALEH